MKCSLSGNTWKSVWDGVSKYTKTTKEQKKNGEEYSVVADFRAYPDIQASINDHSLYLLGAMKGAAKRYEGLSGETDYRKAIQIIKNGGYATDVTYVEKICSIIERWELHKYDVKESEDKMSIEIKEYLLTKSPCYNSGRRITPAGGMLHSIGCPQPDPKVIANNFSVSTARAFMRSLEKPRSFYSFYRGTSAPGIADPVRTEAETIRLSALK